EIDKTLIAIYAFVSIILEESKGAGCQEGLQIGLLGDKVVIPQNLRKKVTKMVLR
ncbi:MAG: hypothetical protein GX428_09480, partial [Candidatus Atribacteria bacterium]|nr:hypothetical protein [Candidatus Atribacteria bacterium]